ncbi:secretion system protein [Kocuria rosea subsp. polaris]|uniref:Secretion system protein n=1 Tax=Kocuria rosea subsp. polaris TaxID=136273 RepID=A0A0W8IQ27_KOCRO|nr:type II secretion system F family protein [Kocuria polaris]KUG61994.1 secretion system protein [Kocuria polaris]
MAPTLTLAAVASGAALALALWAVFSTAGASVRQVRDNLTRGFAAEVTAAGGPVRPSFGSLQRLTTAKGAARLDRLHALAGRPAAWPLSRLLVAKPLLAGVGALLGLLLLAGNAGGRMLALAIVVTAVAYFVPDLLLYSRGIERQRAIGLELPDTLDQMMIAVEAGLGFESAMSRAGENGKGPLAEELQRTLGDMRVGMPRKDAYLALEERTNVPDLRSFTRAVVQADAYGISISSVLRTQAAEMRMKRKQRAEEQAMKIPVKITVPLMLLILPVLLLMIMGPVVLTAMKQF